MTGNTISRVHYFDKQFLRVDEFRDEQLYQLALRRRHNVAEHTWGIVSGLEIANEAGALVVRSGMAIDGYGRELVLADKQRLPLGTFDELGADRLDVWLVYDRLDTGSAPDGYASCSPEGATDAYRSDETPQILLERPLSTVVDASHPPGVPSEVLTAAVPPFSDDRTDLWRVYLGRITRLGTDRYAVDGTYRLYVGVVAESIDHPANATRVEVGKQTSVDATRVIGGTTYVYQKSETGTESRRFAVFVPEEREDGGSQQPVQLSPRLEILKDGTIRMRGRTVINGDLRVANGAVQFLDAADAAEFTDDTAPTVPSIYRVKDGGNDQLRIDLGSSSAANRQLVIGFSSEDGKFTECIKLELDTATGEPMVTINGDLKVEGKIVGHLVSTALSQDALSAIQASFQSGVAAGSAGS